jgi:hypothetical protein
MKHAVIVYGQELPRFPRNLYGLLSSQEGVQYCAREFAKNQGRWFHAARIISYCVLPQNSRIERSRYSANQEHGPFQSFAFAYQQAVTVN